MIGNIEYLGQTSFLSSIEIEDLGNTTVDLFNDIGLEWFIMVKTELGWTNIEMFGPLFVDVDSLDAVKGFNYNYQRIEYNEHKIIKQLKQFIQDPKKCITQAFEVERKDALNRLKNLGLGEEDY